MVAMAHGIDIGEIVVTDEGGGHTMFYEHREKPRRSYHCYHNLAGYFAVALLYPDSPEFYRTLEELDYTDPETGLTGDLTNFNRDRMGASFRHARIEVLQILRERKDDVLEMAGRLYRYGKINYETCNW